MPVKSVPSPKRQFFEAAATSEPMVSNPSRGRPSSRYWLDSDLVVHGGGNSLYAAEVAFSGLDRYMAEEKLNLLQFASGRPT